MKSPILKTPKDEIKRKVGEIAEILQISHKLDNKATEAVEELVKSRLVEGTSVLWVTHDGGQSRRLAGRQLICVAGAISETAP